MKFDYVFLLGTRVDLISLDELIAYTLAIVQNGEKAVISNVNVHALNIAYETAWFRNMINSVQVVFCDGFGVKWAARLLKGKRLQRLTPPDWFGRLALACAERGISMFFLGTRQTIVEKAAENIRISSPSLRIVGMHHGFFDKGTESAESREVVAMINAAKPDILVVGFGMPAQEKWIAENLSQLNVHLAIPVGAFFDYLAEDVVRAPRWMTDNGLEWLGRLFIEPRRLWKRYIVGNPLFLWRILIHEVLGVPLQDNK